MAEFILLTILTICGEPIKMIYLDINKPAIVVAEVVDKDEIGSARKILFTNQYMGHEVSDTIGFCS